ncbi:hypothetical protein FBU30_006273 [Linnemannia zychae]|nr:hypothetical protein FBU30_006273 [Linnemannia zychae]
MSALKHQQDQSTHHQHQLHEHQQKFFDQQRQFIELSLELKRLKQQVEQSYEKQTDIVVPRRQQQDQTHVQQTDLERQPIQQERRRIAHIEQSREELHQRHQQNSLEQLRDRAQVQDTTAANSRSSRGNVPHPEHSSSGSSKLSSFEPTLVCGLWSFESIRILHLRDQLSHTNYTLAKLYSIFSGSSSAQARRHPQ